MIRVKNISKWISFCGAVLGLLIVYNIATPLVAEGSDAQGGWVVVPEGYPCYSTDWFPCGDGQTPGYIGCGGYLIKGTWSYPPWNWGNVVSEGGSPCHSVDYDSRFCGYLTNSHCE